MKMIVVVALAFVAIASAAPAPIEEVKTLKYQSEQQPDGPFRYAVETDNGIAYNADGTIKQVENEDKKIVDVLTIRGQYSYLGEDGQPIVITYEADENGYRAYGPSVPTNRT